jgi:hypothetical protein
MRYRKTQLGVEAPTKRFVAEISTAGESKRASQQFLVKKSSHHAGLPGHRGLECTSRIRRKAAVVGRTLLAED